MSALCQHGPSNSCPSVLVHLLFLPAICQFLIRRPPITETPDFPQMVQAKHHTFFLTGSLPSHAIACTPHDTNTYTCFYNMAFRPRGVVLLGATPSPTRRASRVWSNAAGGKVCKLCLVVVTNNLFTRSCKEWMQARHSRKAFKLPDCAELEPMTQATAMRMDPEGGAYLGLVNSRVLNSTVHPYR